MSINYKQISKQSVKAKNMSDVFASLLFLAVIAVFYTLTYYFNWWNWLNIVSYSLVALTIVSLIWTITVDSRLFYKTFGYYINDQYIYIKRGIFIQKETIIPMTKVQSINLIKNRILKRYGVASIEIATMHSEHEIPYIDAIIAEALRTEIAQFARIKEQEH